MRQYIVNEFFGERTTKCFREVCESDMGMKLLWLRVRLHEAKAFKAKALASASRFQKLKASALASAS